MEEKYMTSWVAGLIITVAMVLSTGCSNKTYIANLKSNNVEIKNAAVFYLGDGKEKKAVPALIALLNPQESKTTRLAVIAALGKIKDKSCGPQLVECMGDQDVAIRSAAMHSLGMVKYTKAVEPLIRAVEDPAVQLPAIWALGMIGDKAAVPVLTRLLSDNDKYVRHNATQALRRFEK